MSSDQLPRYPQKYSGFLLKRIHVADLSHIYGPGHRGIIADEAIKKGDLILENDPTTSMFHPFDSKRGIQTVEEWCHLFDQQSDLDVKEFLTRYSIPYDDKHVSVPRNYLKRDTVDYSVLLNHSCNANCTSTYTDRVIAIKDIDPGNVLTLDYGIGITDDMWPFPFTVCKCREPSCAGADVFKRYQQTDWQEKFYDYCFPCVKSKIDEIRKRKILNNAVF